MAPRKIMVIRHAEKPQHGGAPGIDVDGSHDHKSLLVHGWQRAGAIARYFGPQGGNPVPPIERPQQIFAAFADPANDEDSKRPIQTVSPLAAVLSLDIDTSYKKAEIDKLAAKLRAGSPVVLVSWEHRMIPPLASLLVAQGQAVPDWPDDRFDMVWVFEPAGNDWRLTQVPQLLLKGDQATLFA